jgi:hypothetical protein
LAVEKKASKQAVEKNASKQARIGSTIIRSVRLYAVK